MAHFVLTAVGRDRPGIVDAITGFLHEQGANIEDSRMATLGGEFVVMLLFSAPAGPAGVEGLGRDLDLAITVRPTRAPEEHGREPAIPLRVEVVAMDHPGIAHEVSHLLHDLGVNIVAASSRVTDAPESGGPLFEMVLDVGVPAKVKVAVVRQALERLADRLNLDLSVTKPPR